MHDCHMLAHHPAPREPTEEDHDVAPTSYASQASPIDDGSASESRGSSTRAGSTSVVESASPVKRDCGIRFFNDLLGEAPHQKEKY